MRFGRLCDMFLDALAGLADLPPEPGAGERIDAAHARRRTAELERLAVAAVHRAGSAPAAR